MPGTADPMALVTVVRFTGVPRRRGDRVRELARDPPLEETAGEGAALLLPLNVKPCFLVLLVKVQ